jgi:hypothetical protein
MNQLRFIETRSEKKLRTIFPSQGAQKIGYFALYLSKKNFARKKKKNDRLEKPVILVGIMFFSARRHFFF